MISFDIQNLANNLVMEERVVYSVKEAIATRMFEAAVEIINDPAKLETIMDTLCSIYESEYGAVTPDVTIMWVVNEVKKQMTAHGWDKRLVIKSVFKKLSNTFHQAYINMDLDATLERNQKKDKKMPRVRISGESVSDNPSPDMINEFLAVVERRSERRTPLLSDRYPRFVNDPTGRGWGN